MTSSTKEDIHCILLNIKLLLAVERGRISIYFNGLIVVSNIRKK